jgi:WS/DGAT/MGAT family acyltransferase
MTVNSIRSQGSHTMKQLSSTDSQMLFVETTAAPNHIAPLTIYDPSTAPGGKVTHKGILTHLESRLHLAPGFRRKLMRVPLDLDEPYWVDDPNFDLEYHVRHLALPKPGDWRQLCILVARLISRPLDPSRPMWEMNIIEGLDNIEGLPEGCFAVLLKIHHSMVDGKAGVALISALHDLEARPKRSAKLETPEIWQPKTQPSAWQLAGIGLRRILFKPGHVLKVVARSAPGLISNRDMRKSKPSFRVPNTPLNGEITAPRVYDARRYALSDFKAMRQLVPGATINDLALAVVGGGMRKYLEAKNALPKGSLIASVPISIRTKAEAEATTEGNELAIQNVPLCSEVADPVARLQAICEVMRDTKAYVEAVGARKLADISTAIPGRVAGLLAHSLTTVGRLAGETLMANTVVTNVPGVQVPLYLCGARCVFSGGGGPLNGHIGVIHLVGSYCGEITLNYMAARDLLPDPDFYSQCMDEAFGEYMQAVATLNARPKAQPAAKAAATKLRLATTAQAKKPLRKKARAAAKKPVRKKK